MYTNIRSVQILISLLKQYGIKHVVLSPGSRNTPLAHSIEEDDFFCCYSIVDERSAGYFALGLAEALDVPVCVSCTAATATCNYMPAVQEAWERGIQLVALTADRDRYSMFHMEDQCIDQVDMYHGYVKKAVDIPAVRNQNDEWYCNRCINEAFQAVSHRGKGPVQINYHMPYSLEEMSVYPVKTLPATRKIDLFTGDIDWSDVQSELKKKKRILVVCGSGYKGTDSLRNALIEFQKRYDCAIVYECYSNIGCPSFIHEVGLGSVLNQTEIEQLKPDLIVSFGNVYYATIKGRFSAYRFPVEHWQIAIDGQLNDGYRLLTKVFECRPEEFFENMVKNAPTINSASYHLAWRERKEAMKLPELPFTNFSAIIELAKVIPPYSNLHMSVLDAIRLSDYVDFNQTVKCFANTGADGIDGAMSTMLGQGACDGNLSFLLIGDLSFLYDLNAIVNELPSNVRIFVINNYAGAEFHKNFGMEKIPTLNLHIAAGHHTKIEQCCSMTKMEYLCAGNADELAVALEQFVKEADHAKLLEVFTDADLDAKTLKKYWKENKDEDRKRSLKAFLMSILGRKRIELIKQFIRG